MITAILLIVVPGYAWDRIASSRRSVMSIVLFFLLPLLLLTSLGEGYYLVHYGREQYSFTSFIRKFPLADVVIFETAQIIASLALIFICAPIVKALGETFHGRHTFDQAFTSIAYGLSPLFLLRLAVMIPGPYPWIPWVIGIALSVGALYIGIPRIMEPDPPHAFGLYVMSSILLFFATGLLQVITAGYLQGSSPSLSNAITNLGKHLPF